MKHKDLVDKLLKMADNDDDFEREDRAVMKAAASLLNISMYQVLKLAYRHGYLDGTQMGTRGSNIHIRAGHMGDAYATRMLRGEVTAD